MSAARRLADRLVEEYGDLDALVGEALPALDGEPPAGWTLGEALAQLGLDLPEKVEALRYVSQRLTAEAALLKEEEARLRDRRKAMEASQERVKGLGVELMLGARALGMLEEEKRLRTTTCTAWLQATTRVEGPEDVEGWPAKWRRTITTVEPDRKAAKADLDAGATSEAVRLVTEEGIRWR
jgi:hypothetical protein